MLPLASDADVNGRIIDGIRLQQGIDLVRVQDELPEGAPDSDVVAWAAASGRVLISNDRNTMIHAVKSFVENGASFPGLIVTNLNKQPISDAINDIHLIAEAMTAEELANIRVVYLPLTK